MAAHTKRVDGQKVRPSDWCEKHGLYLPLVAFRYRAVDTVDFVSTLCQQLQDTRKTVATVMMSDLLEDTEFDPTALPGHLDEYMRFLGAWEYPTSQSHYTRWVNPGYLHAREIVSTTETEQRRQRLHEAARVGHLRQSDLAKEFGTTHYSVSKFAKRHDIPWTQLRQEGLERLGRTLYTLTEWGYEVQEVTSMVPRPDTTVRTWIQEYGLNAEWDAPEDPSLLPWFERGELT